MWRPATPAEDDAIVELCLALNREDPGPKPVPAEHTRRTLRLFREQPGRGRAYVLELGTAISGYAFLAMFWSNELGGEICTVDEVYVSPPARSQGHGRQLFSLVASRSLPGANDWVAIDLEVTPANARARKLYDSLGFRPAKNTHMRMRFS